MQVLFRPFMNLRWHIDTGYNHSPQNWDRRLPQNQPQGCHQRLQTAPWYRNGTNIHIGWLLLVQRTTGHSHYWGRDLWPWRWWTGQKHLLHRKKSTVHSRSTSGCSIFHSQLRTRRDLIHHRELEKQRLCRRRKLEKAVVHIVRLCWLWPKKERSILTCQLNILFPVAGPQPQAPFSPS